MGDLAKVLGKGSKGTRKRAFQKNLKALKSYEGQVRKFGVSWFDAFEQNRARRTTEPADHE